MAYIFFYASILLVWLLFLAITYLKKMDIRHLVVGIATIAYSAAFDIILGNHIGLYYYITPGGSSLYIILAAIFLYPFINIIFTLYLPQNTRSRLLYTAAWIGAMLIFEYGSIVFKTIVFTGWKPIPWSIVVYIATFGWIILFYDYLSKKKLAY